MIAFPHHAQRSSRWSAWKSLKLQKNLTVQYEETAELYTIWGYDGPEVHVCTIWKGSVPYTAVESYPQAQNDADRTEFESYYKEAANQQIIVAVDPIPSGSTSFDKWSAFDSQFSLSTSWQSVYSLTGSHVFLGCSFKVSNENGIQWRMLVNGATVFDETLDRLDDLGLLHAESPMWFRNPLEGRFHFIPPEGGLVGSLFDIQFKKTVSPSKTIEFGRTWHRKR